jgi:acyl carrier protein
MPRNQATEIRQLVHQLLEGRGKSASPTDDESLFVAGHLDSMAVIELIMHLERDFSMDLSQFDFDISLIDSISSITRLVEQSQAA